MEWIVLIAVVVVVLAVALAFRRFVTSRYEDIYGDDEPPYQDPPALPNLPTSGGIG